MVQRSAQEGLELLVQPLVDTAHLRFGDAADPAQGVDLVGGYATGVGLHHHCVECYVDPAAWLEPVGEEAVLTMFGDGQGELANLGGEHPLPIAVAVGDALIGAALVELGAGQGRNFSFQ